jgi:hypothetical protein
MSTNYYFHPPPKNVCEHCGRGDSAGEEDPVLHIGKSSAGWCFSLHIYPELNLRTLNDWKSKLEQPGVVVLDSDDRIVSVAWLLETITARSWFGEDGGNGEPVLMGPKGLRRHPLDRHCVGHGEGTWDYLVGEFC